MKWQPIETAPNDGTPFLVWLPVPQLNSNFQVAIFRPNVKLIGGRFAFDASCEPTHWIPLPEPPKEKP